MAVIEVQVPQRDLAQRMDALVRANEIRTYRAGKKIDLKRGRVRVTDLLAGRDPQLESMKVFDLLIAAPKVGRVKANKLLNTARVSPSKTIGGLSPRQRAEILTLIGPR